MLYVDCLKQCLVRRKCSVDANHHYYQLLCQWQKYIEASLSYNFHSLISNLSSHEICQSQRQLLEPSLRLYIHASSFYRVFGSLSIPLKTSSCSWTMPQLNMTLVQFVQEKDSVGLLFDQIGTVPTQRQISGSLWENGSYELVAYLAIIFCYTYTHLPWILALFIEVGVKFCMAWLFPPPTWLLWHSGRGSQWVQAT